MESGTERAGEPFDVVSIGETMVAFVSGHDPRSYRAVAAGAESNVAAGASLLGCRTRWVSRLGDDPLGRLIEESVASAGVDVAVARDDSRPTGVLTKHLTGSHALVRYYRSESAARRLSIDDLARTGRARWMHTTGITAALSDSAAGLAAAVVERRAGSADRVSFDLNLRPALWPDTATAAAALLDLCREADVVFLGDDESEALFGTSQPDALAALILQREGQEVVLKRGARNAVVITREGQVAEPALQADVVDLTGAGDAFAAGYLAASCWGWPTRSRLRLGHLMGSRVVGVVEDVPPPFTTTELDALTPERLASLWDDASSER